MFSLLIKEMSGTECVTEQQKEENQLLWVQRMNNIRNRVTEIINDKLFFVEALKNVIFLGQTITAFEFLRRWSIHEQENYYCRNN